MLHTSENRASHLGVFPRLCDAVTMRFTALLLALSCAHTQPEIVAQASAPIRIELGEINQDNEEVFVRQLNAAAEKGPFVVVIDSPGGSVFAGFRIVKAMEKLTEHTPVICVVDGMAASMALYVFQACSVRAMTSRSLLMGHQPSTAVQGQSESFAQTAVLLAKLNYAMAAFIVARTNISIADYLAKIADGRELWMTSADASHFGFTDITVSSVGQLLTP